MPALPVEVPQEEEVAHTGTAQQEYAHEWRFKRPLEQALHALSRWRRWSRLPINSLDTLDAWRPPKLSSLPSSQTISNFFLVLFTFGLIVTSYWQWTTLDATLEENRRMVEIGRMQAKAAQDATFVAQQALKTSEKSIELTQQALWLDQRAWVMVKTITSNIPSEGFPISATITVTNTGRTPANNTEVLADIKLLKSLPVPISPPSDKLPPSKGVITPGNHFDANVKTDSPLEGHHIQSLKDEQLTVFVWGKIVYSDIFEQKHETLFCGLYRMAQKAFVFCPNNNSAK